MCPFNFLSRLWRRRSILFMCLNVHGQPLAVWWYGDDTMCNEWWACLLAWRMCWMFLGLLIRNRRSWSWRKLNGSSSSCRLSGNRRRVRYTTSSWHLRLSLWTRNAMLTIYKLLENTFRYVCTQQRDQIFLQVSESIHHTWTFHSHLTSYLLVP